MPPRNNYTLSVHFPPNNVNPRPPSPSSSSDSSLPDDPESDDDDYENYMRRRAMFDRNRLLYYRLQRANRVLGLDRETRTLPPPYTSLLALPPRQQPQEDP